MVSFQEAIRSKRFLRKLLGTHFLYFKAAVFQFHRQKICLKKDSFYIKGKIPEWQLRNLKRLKLPVSKFARRHYIIPKAVRFIEQEKGSTLSKSSGVARH